MNKTLALGLAIVLGVGVGAAVFLYPRPGDVPPPPQLQKPDAGRSGIVLDEAARQPYVAASVRVSEVKVAPDKKPDRDEVVPGLLQVTGTLVNAGEHTVDQVFLTILPMDADGNVLSSFEENVAKPSIGAGETRSFKFTIPANSAFSGQFQHKLH